MEKKSERGRERLVGKGLGLAGCRLDGRKLPGRVYKKPVSIQWELEGLVLKTKDGRQLVFRKTNLEVPFLLLLLLLLFLLLLLSSFFTSSCCC